MRRMGRETKNLQPPGIEPGPPAWQAEIIPLDNGCLTIRRTNFPLVKNLSEGSKVGRELWMLTIDPIPKLHLFFL